MKLCVRSCMRENDSFETVFLMKLVDAHISSNSVLFVYKG